MTRKGSSMYVDESGGHDDGSQQGDELTVHADGHDYHSEENADIDGDGHMDAAVVKDDHGGGRVYYDSNHDGTADQYAEVDSSGHVTAEAHYDASTGEWTPVDHGNDTDTTSTDQTTTSHDGGDDHSSDGGHMEVTLPGGEQKELPAPTVDTNHDGVPDTVVAKDDHGNTVYFTDSNGDGQADMLVIEHQDGSLEAAKSDGHGHWQQIDTSGAQAPSQEHGIVADDNAPVIEGLTV